MTNTKLQSEKRGFMTQNKNKMIREKTERITERQEQKGKRNVRFLPIIYWTD